MANIQFNVLLKTPKDINNFIETSCSVKKDISITAGHGKYLVDGRSIMGLYSLNLAEPIKITMESDVLNEIDIFKAADVFNPWIYNKR